MRIRISGTFFDRPVVFSTTRDGRVARYARSSSSRIISQSDAMSTRPPLCTYKEVRLAFLLLHFRVIRSRVSPTGSVDITRVSLYTVCVRCDVNFAFPFPRPEKPPPPTEHGRVFHAFSFVMPVITAVTSTRTCFTPR